MKIQLRLLASLLAAAALLTAARADEGLTTATVRFSDPAKPGTLRVGIPWADIRVAGGDVSEITVRSSLNEKNKSKRTVNGLRRLDEDVSFELLEKDNVVHLAVAGDGMKHGHGAEFQITVPRNTNLVLSTDWGGDIQVKGVEGDLDINSMNGEVLLDGVASSAVVNTMNGEITANFKAAPAKPVSLTSMNGEINVRLPADTKASLRLRTHNGSILTDFPEDLLKTQTEVRTGASAHPAAMDDMARAHAEAERVRSEAAREAEEAVRVAAEVARTVVREVKREIEVGMSESGRAVPRAPKAPRPPRVPLPSSFGGKSITGSLNGGGVDISLTSMNGTITLRQAKQGD